MSGVSVALPVHRAGRHFEAAVGSILNQSLRELELMIVLNGADSATKERASAIARTDGRIRLIELPEANLAAALNAALGLARHELVARMDSDDLSLPRRLELQAERMRAEPSLVGLGCAFERMDESGRTLQRIAPPTTAGETRWRLLLENVFAHGSMMLRRSPVLDAGGYDERAVRAQDYELWLRLSARGYELANLPETLYRYRERAGVDVQGPWLPDREQARVAAAAMQRAWQSLPTSDSAALSERIAEALGGAAPGAEVCRTLGEHMREFGPTSEGLIAYLWAHWLGASRREQAMLAGRRALAREAGARLRSAGASDVWLWGAGAHTAWLLQHQSLLGVPIRGIIDDHAPGRVVGGMRAEPPSVVARGSHVLLSSESCEDAMWQASGPLRARGVSVWRFFREPDDAVHERRSQRRESAA